MNGFQQTVIGNDVLKPLIRYVLPINKSIYSAVLNTTIEN